MKRPFSVTAVNKFLYGLEPRRVRWYDDYWKQNRPLTVEEYYDHWLFAYLTPRTGWEQSVKGFIALKERLRRGDSIYRISRILAPTGCGLQNERAIGIWDFSRRYWKDPEQFHPYLGEGVFGCRDRIATFTHGIKLAKVSFVLERTHLRNYGVVCLDSHMLGLYGYNRPTAPGKMIYHAMEHHWADTCDKLGFNTGSAKDAYWDPLHGFNDCRYWSWPFETAAYRKANPLPKEKPIYRAA